MGSIIGWRGAFFALVPVAGIALVWQWIALPSHEAGGTRAWLWQRVQGAEEPPFDMAWLGAEPSSWAFALFTYLRVS